MTLIWCIVPEIWSVTDVIFCHFGPFFLPFCLPNNLKILYIWKNHLKILYIISHMCTINDKLMMYDSWDIKRDGCNCYFSFWTIFCSFTPLIAPKRESSKKWKKPLEKPSFYTSVPKIVIMCYTVPEIWCMIDVIVSFHFGLSFALLPS